MKEVAIQDLQLNPFGVFGKDWMALTAGNGFVDQGLIDFNYPDRDFHTIYVGKIVKVLVNEKAE